MAEKLEWESADSLTRLMTRFSILFIHQNETSDDSEARRILTKEFGSAVKIVRRQETGKTNGIVPELVASGTSYSGLDEIRKFVSYVRSLQDNNKNAGAAD